jgi:hypothetical protein
MVGRAGENQMAARHSGRFLTRATCGRGECLAAVMRCDAFLYSICGVGWLLLLVGAMASEEHRRTTKVIIKLNTTGARGVGLAKTAGHR